MTTLHFYPGPRLTRTDWNGDLGKHVEHDVTERAAEYLFEPTELKGTTLADFFELVRLNPLLLHVYRRDFIEDYLDEVAKGYEPRSQSDAEDPEDAIEYLELYNLWELDTHSKTYEMSTRPSFHGVGVLRTKDHEHYPAGTRTQWGLLGSSVRSLLPLEVRFNPKVVVTEGDMARKSWGSVVREEVLPPASLGQMLSGVFWELSFHGSPKSTEELFDGLREQVAELRERGSDVAETQAPEASEESGSAEDSPPPTAKAQGQLRTISHEEVFGDLYAREFAANFLSASVKPSRVVRALRDLADDADPQVELARKFGEGSVVFRPEALGLSAYALRRRHYDRVGATDAASMNADGEAQDA